MVDDYEWALGLQASFQPVGADDDEERIIGKIIEIRDDSPWPDEEHCRVVLDAGDQKYDVAKHRIDLE